MKFGPCLHFVLHIHAFLQCYLVSGQVPLRDSWFTHVSVKQILAPKENQSRREKRKTKENRQRKNREESSGGEMEKVGEKRAGRK